MVKQRQTFYYLSTLMEVSTVKMCFCCFKRSTMKQIVHLSLRQESIKGIRVSKNMTELKWGGSQFFLPMARGGSQSFC